ncbi:A disintegrin and metalloproteinase with thrombospondin motifs like [Argiope bruennichi]|uniref:A disintegrin and metalloproteinase with thrombospondin motifs like n=1 Tax=Argiope bruennichi TaxID=94029 RepID=UPI0024943389|nr:A disintegrin and metalloproteinase with thrombospondin motifs like [Argiope bruennichi]XP_055951547.1 A disintegrin and metalloproteinase with thrombospondin motifs like [Argiope bruennichi]
MGFLKSANIMPILCFNLLTICIQGSLAFPDLSYHRQTNSSRLEQLRNGEPNSKDYEIVQLRILSKRSADDKDVIRVHFSAFGKNIHLRLQKNEDFNDKLEALRVYEATMSYGDIKLEEIILKGDDLGIPYIDPVQMAAVTIRHAPDGILQMDGVIGDDLRIKPASNDIDYLMEFFDYVGEFEDDNRIINFGKNGRNILGNSSSTRIKSGLHLVYRSLTKSTMSSKSLPLDDVLNNIDSADDGRHRKGPLHAWPEVLLMVDYNTYEMHLSHGFNDTQIRNYYISFLNGVDLRFKTLTNPKISLILSQIVIFKSMDATPFLKENIFPGTNIFNGDKAMTDLGRHLYSARKKSDLYPEFDLAILLTHLDTCSDHIICDRSTAGIAYLMGACTTHQSNEQWMGVAIVEDRGGFDGILTAAHEIGHLLGADHDGTPNYRLGLRDSLACNLGDGYIMSHTTLSSRMFQWSECSVKQFRYFLSSERASCLFNQPNYPNKLENSVLPGVVLSLDEQCNRMMGSRACAWDSRVCTGLLCYDTVFGIEPCWVGLTPAPAAEGSPCGEDLHCMHGKCVSKFLIYSQAWHMEHRNAPKISTTEKPVETCTEDSDEFFCESYFWTIGRKEACKNSRIFEECCYSHKVLCKVRSL